MILFIFKCKNSLNDIKKFYFLFVLLHISFLFIFMFLNDLTTLIVNKNFLALNVLFALTLCWPEVSGSKPRSVKYIFLFCSV